MSKTTQTPQTFELSAIDGTATITAYDAEIKERDDSIPAISFIVQAHNRKPVEVLASKADCLDLLLFLFEIVNEWGNRTIMRDPDESFIDGLYHGLGPSGPPR